MTRSATCSLARKMPLCQSMASTSVVLPWSTWAMMATLRMSGRCGMSFTVPRMEWRTSDARWGIMTSPIRRSHVQGGSFVKARIAIIALVALFVTFVLPVPGPIGPVGAQQPDPPGTQGTPKGGKKVKQTRGHHHGEGRRDRPRVLPGGCAQDGGELRDAGQEGLLRRGDLPPRGARTSSSRAAIPRATAPAGPATPSRTSSTSRSTSAARWRWRARQDPDSAGSQFYITLGPRRIPRRPVHRLRHGSPPAWRSSTRSRWATR